MQKLKQWDLRKISNCELSADTFSIIFIFVGWPARVLDVGRHIVAGRYVVNCKLIRRLCCSDRLLLCSGLNSEQTLLQIFFVLKHPCETKLFDVFGVIKFSHKLCSKRGLDHFLFFVDFPAYISTPKGQSIRYYNVKEDNVDEEPVVEQGRRSIAVLSGEIYELHWYHRSYYREVEDDHAASKTYDAPCTHVTRK